MPGSTAFSYKAKLSSAFRGTGRCLLDQLATPVRHDDAKIIHRFATIVARVDDVAMLIRRDAFIERIADLVFAQQPSVGNEWEPLLVAPTRCYRGRIICHDCRDRRAARNRPRPSTPISATQTACN